MATRPTIMPLIIDTAEGWPSANMWSKLVRSCSSRGPTIEAATKPDVAFFSGIREPCFTFVAAR